MGRGKFHFEHRKNARQKKQRSPLVVSLPISLYKGPVQSLQSLHSCLASQSLPQSWTIAATEPLTIVKLRVSPTSLTPKVDVVITLAIHNGFTWSLSVFNQHLDPTLNDCLSHVSRILTTASSVLALLEKINSLRLCVGNPDQKFLDLWNYRSSTLHGLSGKSVDL